MKFSNKIKSAAIITFATSMIFASTTAFAATKGEEIAWQRNNTYSVGTLLEYNNKYYIVAQLHTAYWTPETIPAICKEVSFTDDGTLIWFRPYSSIAFKKGDVVSFNNKKYISISNFNVYSPSEVPHLWEEIPEYPVWQADTNYPVGTIVSFGVDNNRLPKLYRILQPSLGWSPMTGGAALFRELPRTADGDFIWVAFEAYKAGDVVSFNGKLYASKNNNNVHSPSAWPAGWEAVN